MKNDIEFRVFPEFAVRDNAGKPQISGYAAMFNSFSCDLGGFREQIAPGAFRKTLQESDVRALWNHDTGIVLGRSGAGTLALHEDKTGLSITIDPPDSAAAMMESIRRGDVDQMSFGFQAIRDQWDLDRATDTVTRTLLEVRLFEVSVVAFPAYPATSASVRCIEKAQEIRSKFVATDVTKPDVVLHLADHRRMSLALAERQR